MAMAIVLVLAWMVCFGFLNYIVKYFVNSMPNPLPQFADSVLLVIGSPYPYMILLLYGVCAALYVAALRVLPLSTAGPLFLVAGILVTFAVGVWRLGEPLTVCRCVGAMLCLLGAVLLLR